MAMSIDALLAMLLFIALVAFISLEPISEMPITQPMIAVNQLVDDAMAAMNSTGFIMEIVENSAGKTKTGLEADMQQKLQGLLPEQTGFRLEMLQYASNLDDPVTNCRETGATFEDCFPQNYPLGEDNPKVYLEVGNPVPADKEVFHGRKIFIKKQPGDCVTIEICDNSIDDDADTLVDCDDPDCTTSPNCIEFKKKEESESKLVFRESKPKQQVLRFQAEICDNSIDDDADTLVDCDDPDCIMLPNCIDMSFTFSSSVTVGGLPVTEIACDEEALVKLQIDREANTRVPVDIIFAASKNHSMGECTIASGRPGGTLVDSGETGATRNDFQRVPAFDFVVTVVDAGAVDTVLSWTETATCTAGTNCPELRLKSPTGIFYGAGQGTTEQNSRVCNEENPVVGDKAGQSQRAYYYNNRTYYDYLALGSALVETGTWEVWVRNTIPTDYSIEVKYIGNSHWIEGTPDAQILPWNEPISKVDIAKVLITEFANRAEWQVEDQDPDKRDKYAYAEIGLPEKVPADTGSNIQPSAGLKDAKDIGPPIGSQLKNLDSKISEISAPAYFYILKEPGLINEELAKRPEWSEHTKFAIIYGDSSDDSQGTYTKQQAIDDAVSKGIFYYSIDLSNELIPGNDTCQTQDLYDLGWQTGGRCYAAHDESALAAILDIIAVEIGVKSGVDPDPVTTTLVLDFPNEFQYSFFDNSLTHPHSWDDPTSTLTFESITIISGLWNTEFDLVVPCDFTDCENYFSGGKTVEMPPATTILNYEIEGEPQDPVTWPMEQVTTVLMKFRDLAIEFIAGHFYGVNEVSIEYRVSNVGYFDVDLANIAPTVNFHLGDFPSEACDPIFYTNITSYTFPAGTTLNAAYPTPGLETNIETSQELSESGYLCLYLNEEQDVSECSGNNAVVVQCDIPKTFVYVLDYWAWEK